MMDATLKKEIISEVRRAAQAAFETKEEQWLTADQLCKVFGMFSKSWLKTYGHSLPRTQAVVVDEEGREHRTCWAYPRHRIQAMIENGQIKELRCQLVSLTSQGREFGKIKIKQ